MAPAWLLGSLITGIVWAVKLPLLSGTWLWLLPIALSACWWRIRHSPAAWLTVLLATVLVGYLLTDQAWHQPRPAHHVSRFADKTPRVIEAELLSAEQSENGSTRVIARGLRIAENTRWTAVTGRFLIFFRNGALQAQPGQIFRTYVRLKQPKRFGTPGEFDFPLALAARGIFVTANLGNAEELVILADHPESRIRIWETVRTRIARQIGASVPDEHVGLVQALVIGQRGNILPTQRDLVNGGGVAHLFAISGLHFGLLALFLYQAASWIYRRSSRLMLWIPPQRLLPPLLIVPLYAYLMLSGCSWSTQRAFLMTVIAGCLLYYRRRTKPLAVLTCVALLLLLSNPLALFQPGFQLSFAGLAGILATLPIWQRNCAHWPKPLRAVSGLLLTTAVATLATTPLVLWHFHQFASAGLLANLVALPLIAWGAVPAGLLGALCTGLHPDLATFAFQVCGWLIALTLDWLHWLTDWPWLQARTHYTCLSDVLSLCAIILSLLLWAHQCKRGHRHGVAMVISLLVWAGLWSPQNEGLRLVAFSVGQGDATLVSFDDRHFLVDGGGLPGTDFDPGSRLVAPALGRLGVKRLAAAVLTHNHPDHRDGLVHILSHFPADEFWSAVPKDELPIGLQQVLTERQIPVRHPDHGWSQVWSDPDRSLQIFTPQQRTKDLNERSLVVVAADLHNAALLTADLGARGFAQLEQSGSSTKISLLKIPHHGSRHSAPSRFLDHYQPRLAFVSAGFDNVYRLPHAQTLNDCHERDVPVYRTDLDGSLAFISHGNGWRVDSLSPVFRID